MGQISLQDGALSKYGEAGGRYIDLFVGAIRQYGMLCIGLYRSLKYSTNDEVFLVEIKFRFNSIISVNCLIVNAFNISEL